MLFHHLQRILCVGVLLAACTLNGGDGSDSDTDTPNTSSVDTGTVGDTGGTSDEPTGGSANLCGWNNVEGYYSCAPDGDPGVEDPLGEYPIACADSMVASGAACADNMPVGSIGCCAGDQLFYCDQESGLVVQEICEAPVDPTSGTTEDAPTSTTDAPTGGDTSETGETDGAKGCGWNSVDSYYACAPDGTPGAEDPDGIDPLACDGTLTEGEACSDDNGPVNSSGCCDTDVLFFCQDGIIVRQDCTA